MNQYHVIHPKTHMRVLSKHEIEKLREVGSVSHELLRRCCYAVLNAGQEHDSFLDHQQQESFQQFNVRVDQLDRGIALELTNPPERAFVDGEIIRGVREQLFSVLRDILYVDESIVQTHRFDLTNSEDITNSVFHILRNAGVLKPDIEPNLVICWGGHSIPRYEYDYTKRVGYELGLRGLDIGTGCGPGAMKGPMKGATIGHAKQHIRTGRYIGITEPGIIASEAPNPIVNELVILPDIEKRLEAFVRMAHGIIIFPGGAGTAEEIVYLLGVLAHPDNQEMPFPIIITGPEQTADYLHSIDDFIGATLGPNAQQHYQVIIGDAAQVAKQMHDGVKAVHGYRRSISDAYFYNWRLNIDPVFQYPFDPTHKAMSQLPLHQDLPTHELASNLRKVFSGIVEGNVKETGVLRVREHGPYQISGDPDMMKRIDQLLAVMVQHGPQLPKQPSGLYRLSILILY